MHFYWGRNKPLSYMRYLSIKSFVDLNPDWRVILHSPDKINYTESWGTREQKSLNPSVDYYDKLETIVQHKIHDTLPDISEVQRSDILRIFLLANGGFYSDSDILYTKPMSTFLASVPEDTKAVVCIHPVDGYHSIGFLGASEDNKTFKELLKVASAARNTGYQTFGSHLYYEYIYPPFKEPTYNIPFETVYPVIALETVRLFQKTPLQLSDNTIGIHWFGGDVFTSRYENNILDSNINTYDNYLINLMKGVV